MRMFDETVEHRPPFFLEKRRTNEWEERTRPMLDSLIEIWDDECWWWEETDSCLRFDENWPKAVKSGGASRYIFRWCMVWGGVRCGVWCDELEWPSWSTSMEIDGVQLTIHISIVNGTPERMHTASYAYSRSKHNNGISVILYMHMGWGWGFSFSFSSLHRGT